MRKSCGGIRKRKTDPEIKAHWDVDEASPAEWAGVAMSELTADECDKALGQKLEAEEGRLHGNSVRAAGER